jgi:cobalt/nickel transport protein
MKTIDNNTFIIIGVVLAIAIGVIAVFFASGDPDGLESTALFVQGEKDLMGQSPEEGDAEAIGTGVSVYSSPFPDYSMGEHFGPIGSIAAIVIGTLAMVAVALGAVRVIRMKA